MGYVDTYYSRAVDAAAPVARLAGAVEADVAVVGGGLAGLSTALELARKGRRVAVVEANRIGFGASGRNGGIVSPGWSARHATIELYAGKSAAKALHHLTMEGVAMIEDNIRDLAIDGAAPVYGHLSAARHENTAAFEARRDWLAREFDYPAEVWSRERVAEALVSPVYRQGLYSPRAFHFHPLLYARALAAEIRRLGGEVYEESPARVLERDGPAWLAGTADGGVRARDLVLATGGYTGALEPRLARSFLPISTYVMLTEPAPALLAGAIRTPAAIGDGRRAGDYYRLVEGGTRLLWGGRITTRVSEPRRLAERLRADMVGAYPQLAPLKVDVAWSGLMSYARHLMPQIARLEDGLWCCTAFGGHGMNTTAIGGRVVAEAIAGEGGRIALFKPFGLAWNGGVFGRAAAQATYWWLQANDAIAELHSA